MDVCPFDALFWSPEFSYADTDVAGLTHERDQLREWMWTFRRRRPPTLEPAGQGNRHGHRRTGRDQPSGWRALDRTGARVPSIW